MCVYMYAVLMVSFSIAIFMYYLGNSFLLSERRHPCINSYTTNGAHNL